MQSSSDPCLSIGLDDLQMDSELREIFKFIDMFREKERKSKALKMIAMIIDIKARIKQYAVES